MTGRPWTDAVRGTTGPGDPDGMADALAAQVHQHDDAAAAAEARSDGPGAAEARRLRDLAAGLLARRARWTPAEAERAAEVATGAG